ACWWTTRTATERVARGAPVVPGCPAATVPESWGIAVPSARASRAPWRPRRCHRGSGEEARPRATLAATARTPGGSREHRRRLRVGTPGALEQRRTSQRSAAVRRRPDVPLSCVVCRPGGLPRSDAHPSPNCRRSHHPGGAEDLGPAVLLGLGARFGH